MHAKKIRRDERDREELLDDLNVREAIADGFGMHGVR
jgi:hypothetical protein